MKSSTVTSLNNQVKACLETTFVSVFINGEISNLTNHKSGHSYFVIKDEYSCIKCVLFKGNKHKIKIDLENGSQVEIKGALTVYSPRGEYQIICSDISLFGQGNLYQEYEILKKELLDKGYFDKSRKKPINRFLNHIVIITSESGAVIKDIFNVSQKRWPLIKLQTIDTIVQGAKAPSLIAKSIKKAHTYNPDVILLARGGGSIEDLWAFNSKEVAQAIFEATIPIVSAIGHESDFLISDLVADVRAPTPSAAMEILLVDMNEQIQYIDDLKSQIQENTNKIFQYKQKQVLQLKENTKSFVIRNQFGHIYQDIIDTKNTFTQNIEYILQKKAKDIPNMNYLYSNIISTKINNIQQDITNHRNLLEQHNPEKIPNKGKAKILKNDNQVALKDIKINDIFSLRDKDFLLDAKAIKKTKSLK